MKKAVCSIVLGLLPASWLYAAVYNVTDFCANGSDSLSDCNALQTVLDKAIGAGTITEIRVPSGIYYLDRAIYIFSNTRLVLDSGAKMVRMNGASDKIMLIGRHCTADGKYCTGGSACQHGGHTQIHDITISGGVWDAACNGSDYIGIFHLCHGDGIAVQNATFRHAGDHTLNFSGSANVSVSGCTFEDTVGYTGTDPSYWSGYAVGDVNRYNTIESIHLDITDANGEQGNYPEDSTPCENVVIDGCTFSSVFSGVGNHHADQAHLLHSLTVRNCTFSNLRSYAAYVYGMDGVKLTGNRVNSGAGLCRSSYAVLEASGNRIIGSTEYSIFLDDSADAQINGNAITNGTDHAVYVVNAKADVARNTIYHSGVCGIRANKSRISASRNEISRSNSYGISISDCSGSLITSNQVSAANDSGIVLSGGSSSCVGNVISGSGDCGIRAMSGVALTVTGNRISNPVSHGMSVTGSSLTATGNEVTSAGAHGFVVDGSSLTASGNTVTGSTRSGFWLTNCSNVNVKNNTVSSPGERGIYLNTYSGFTLSGNNISDTKNEGVYVHKSSGGDVVGNTIMRSTGIGIRVEGSSDYAADDVKVAGNFVASAGAADIRICDYAARSVVCDNVCGGATGTTFAESARSTTKYNPADARSVQVVRDSLDEATISWTAMTGIDGFIIECSKTADFSAPLSVAIDNSAATGGQISGLSSSADWYIRVRSYDIIGSDRYESTGAEDNAYHHQWDEYFVIFNGGGATEGTMSVMRCKIGKVYALPANAFSLETKKFNGWRCSNGRIYDDGVAFFNLSNTPGSELTMTAIWK